VFFTYIGLANGVNLHPSYFSLYVAFSILFLLIELSEKTIFRYQHVLTILVISIFLITLILLSSRIIIFSLGGIFVIMAAYEYWYRRSRKYVALIFILLCGFGAGIFINPISRHRNWNELVTMSYGVSEKTHYRTSSEIRASLWWLGWKSFQSVNPVFGAGAGNVTSVMKAQGERFKITNVLDTYDPHNQFLYLLIANGIAGLGMFLTILTISFIAAFRQKQLLTFVFLTLFTMMCITESALELQKGIVFFALLFSLLISRTPSVDNVPSTSTLLASARN
jgi:O-antigen ligase